MSRPRSPAVMPAPFAVPGHVLTGREWEDLTSITFAAEQTDTGTPVHIKVLKTDSIDSRDRNALRHDYHIARNANAKGVLRPLEFGTTETFPYIVLPDDGTRPLREVLLEGQLDLLTSLELLTELAAIAGRLHSCDIIHGNISPFSVWCGKIPLVVRLSDFSRAIRRGENSEHPTLPADLHYLAPEQSGRTDSSVDGRADLYAIGALAYRLFTGSAPFIGENPIELIHAHLGRLPAPPISLNAALPKALSNLALRLLAKSPEDRYQTAAALHFDLSICTEELRAHGSIGEVPLGTRDVSAGFRVSSRLYGREEECAVLRAALKRAAQGSREIVLISGAAGIGKSRLVKGIEDEAREIGAFVSGKFDQYKENEPYSAVVHALRQAVDLILAEGEELLETWRQAISDALGVNGGLITDVIPELEVLIGVQPAVQELPPAARRHRFNRVFRRFVRVIAVAERPLLMFLDDMQWADEASLALIDVVLQDAGISHLLLIATYRDGEVRNNAALGKTLEGLRRVRVSEIRLGPLSVERVAQLLADTLGCSVEDTFELASHVTSRTEGNPFFIYQLLVFLHQNRLITFNFDNQTWRWDLDAIAAEGITDDVVKLMTRKLSSLPPLSQNALKLAACLGLRFSVRKLAVVMACDPTMAEDALSVPAREGLVIRVKESPGEAVFQFLHDRIQQAAYALILPFERERLRLDIGRKLLASLSDAEGEIVPFAILDNLNDGHRLVSDPGERVRIADLNLLAARRARARAAFQAALGYFRSGLHLLTIESWQSHYTLTLALHLETFECAYATAHYEEANELFEATVKHARTPIDQSRAYYLKVLLCSGLDRSDEAVSLGVSALELLGERLNAHPTKLQLFFELAKVVVQARARDAGSLLNLPQMTDSTKRAIINLLMAICPAAYFRNPDLMALSALKIVRMSLRYGQTNASPFGYVLYGLVRSALLHDYKIGQEFGRLAVDLADRNGIMSQTCKIRMIFSGFINFWTRPIESSVEMLRRSLQGALDCGDVQYANYSILQIIFLRMARGDRLDDVAQECSQHEAFIEQTRDWFAISSHKLRQQAVSALKGKTVNGWTLTDELYDEEAAANGFDAAGNLTVQCYYLILKMQLSVLFGRHDDARRLANECQPKIRAVLSQVMAAEYEFYCALSCAAMLQNAPLHRAELRVLRAALRKLRRWALHSPENFSPYHLLVQAEYNAVRGAVNSAERSYDAAIAAAEEFKCAHIEAMANELAGGFYLRRRRANLARGYLLAARNAYRRWGATAKLEEIVRKHGPMLGDVTEPEHLPIADRNGKAQHLAELIDLDIVLRASREGRESMVGQRVLQQIGRLMTESTGGERVLFIRPGLPSPTVELVVLREGGASGRTDFSVRVATYVLRTGNRVALADPSLDARFKICDHIQSARPRTIICMPLLRHGEVMGAAYLDNVSTASLGPDRLNTLSLLGYQAALLLDNERLGRNLRDVDLDLKSALQKLELLQRVRERLTKFVPQSLQRLVEDDTGGTEIGSRMEDLSILFLDLADYTRMSENYKADELNKIVETYFSSFLDDIRAYGGEINEVAGDGLMIIFQDGDPAEHARRAVRAALAILAKAAQLNSVRTASWPEVLVNIGIHSGEGLIGVSKMQGATAAFYVYSVTGYAANLAARIGAAAKGGVILISEDTAQRLDGSVALAGIGPQQFKGISRPIDVFRVLEQTGAERAIHFERR